MTIVVCDTETTGLNPNIDHIWEFSGIRVEPDRFDYGLHIRIEHDRTLAANLPDTYRQQHDDACDSGPLMPAAATCRTSTAFTSTHAAAHPPRTSSTGSSRPSTTDTGRSS